MLFGYSQRDYVETQNSDVNMAAMDAAFNLCTALLDIFVYWRSGILWDVCGL